MGIEENKRVMNQFIERISKGDISSGEYLTDDFIIHELHTGRDLDKKGYLEHSLALSITDFEIHDIVAEDDKIITRSTIRASQKPTGRNITMSNRFSVYRFEDNQIAEIWFLNDGLSVYQQMGLIPSDGEIGI